MNCIEKIKQLLGPWYSPNADSKAICAYIDNLEARITALEKRLDEQEAVPEPILDFTPLDERNTNFSQ